MSYKSIDRNLKTASVAVLKSTEHDVTLTSFVADLLYPGISIFLHNVWNWCERGCWKFGVDVCIYLGDIARKRERGGGLQGAEYFCWVTNYCRLKPAPVETFPVNPYFLVEIGESQKWEWSRNSPPPSEVIGVIHPFQSHWRNASKRKTFIYLNNQSSNT